MAKVKTYFEEKLPSMFRVPTVKWKSESFSLNNKMFKTKDEAEAYLAAQVEQIGVFEITHVYGDKNASCPNHSYVYRGFEITNFDRTPDQIMLGSRIQFLMVDLMADDGYAEFHGDRESLGLALDYIDAYLYKVAIGKIKVKRSEINRHKNPSNVKHIIIHTDTNRTNYLAWQKPAWDDSGYFWTDRKTFMKVLRNSTNDHPFLFDSKRDACTWLRLSGITARCKIATIKINKSTKLNDPDLDSKYAYPGISADINFF